MKKAAIFLVTICFFVSSMGLSQEIRKSKGPRRQLATIIFSGLGGAILGLSTLSFYGRPQERLANIAIGFAAGVIAGTIFVTYRSATSKDYYDENQERKTNGFIPPSPDHLGEQAQAPKSWELTPTLLGDPKSPQLGGQLTVHF